MAINETAFIWHNGRIKPWDEARVHVLSHALHYGSSVFEGIRVYATPGGPAAFRLGDHLERLMDSARLYRMPVPWPAAELAEACRELVRVNTLESAYLRPILFRGYGSLGVVPGAGESVDGAIAAVEWGAYLGEASREAGVDVCVSSWRRPAPGTLPALAKAGGNYLSSQLISMEAKANGYHEGIALSADGQLSEGAGENLFLVHRGVLFTPPLAASVLGGITRDTVLSLARDLGLEAREQPLPREMLNLADEAFLTGTAAEITPIRSVDRIPVGEGGRGPVTQALQDAFFGLFDGTTADRRGWLDRIAETSRGEGAADVRAAVPV